MAQRVSVIAVPVDDLASVVEALRNGSAARAALARDLAARHLAHAQRAALNEAIGAAAQRSFPVAHDRFDFARFCLPFLTTARTSDDIARDVRHCSTLSLSDLEAHLRRVAGALGASSLGPIDVELPTQSALEAFIASRLDASADLRTEPRPTPAMCAHVGRLMGELFAVLSPCFWQGNNRWLGAAAHPETSGARALFSRASALLPSGFMTLFRRTAPPTSAFPALPALARVVRSIGDMAPALVDTVPEKVRRAGLPAGGSGGAVTGGVACDDLGALVEALAEPATRTLPFVGVDEWLELVRAAALLAREARAHLFEGDDVERIAPAPRPAPMPVAAPAAPAPPVFTSRFATCCVGRRGRSNHFAFCAAAGDVVAVFKGTGGGPAGRRLAERVEDDMTEPSSSDVAARAAWPVAVAERSTRARLNPSFVAHGAMASLAVGDGYVVTAHVGDARVYRIRGNEVDRLTRDHIVHPMQPDVLVRAIGVGVLAPPEVARHDAAPGDVFVVCTRPLADVIGHDVMVRLPALGVDSMLEALLALTPPEQGAAVAVLRVR